MIHETNPDGVSRRLFPDTPEGHAAFQRYLVARFGSDIEWRISGFGIEVRATPTE